MRKLLPIFLLVFAACTAPAATVSVSTLQAVTVALTPSLQPLTTALYACAGPLPDAALALEVASAEAVDLQAVDLAFHLGEPSVLPAFAAPVAWEHILVVLHAENEVGPLTQAQLRELFNGRLRNWGQLEGPDLDVGVWTPPQGDDLRSAFESLYLDSSRISPLAKLAPSPAQTLDVVSQDEGAIGYVPAAWQSSELQVIPTGIRLPVLALASAEPQDAARALLSCLQAEAGQQILSSVYQPLNED